MDQPSRPELSHGAVMSAKLRGNITAMRARAEEEARNLPWHSKLADAITRFTGSMKFVALHLVLYGAWILINLRVLPILPAWDPTFVVLAMVASVEAIFLSTFILISQNRQAHAAERRAELDLHITLLAEHEITKIGQLLDRMAERMGLDGDADPDFQEIKTSVAPVEVLDVIEREGESGMEGAS